MSVRDIKQLEAEIALMRAAGRTHLPVSLTTIEKLIACLRKMDGHPASS